ncbi:MAG: biotin transporter BioY [Ruminococcaceae bacterium]|nr:biotin transporter BioY [Oscillospiraceae bacterium]
MKKRISVRAMVFTAIMAAVICIAAPLCVPVPSGIPLSLATFAVMLSGTLLGRGKGTAAVAVYILLGLVGIPVFSGFMGGFAHIAGATGGFILGYLPCAFLTGLFTELFGGKAWAMVTGMALGTLSLYALGTVWFMLYTGSGLAAALLGCVVPFLVGDAVKIVAVCALAVPLRKKLLPMLAHACDAK